MNFVFPSKFVYWEKLQNHQQIKNKYLKKIYDDSRVNETTYRNKKSWKCKVISSFFSEEKILSIFDQNFFNDVIWNPFDNMLIEMKEKLDLPIPNQSKIYQLWYNVYHKGEWQEIHNHCTPNAGSNYSGIYLMESSEDNKTVFYDPTTITAYNTKSATHYSTEHLTEGTVILFPSELDHYVNPCLNKRVTISFNIISQF
jgi:hypothetical protein